MGRLTCAFAGLATYLSAPGPQAAEHGVLAGRVRFSFPGHGCARVRGAMAAHARPAVERLRRALDEAGAADTWVTTRVITEQAEAERMGFTGSPTILIDGRDPFAEPGRAAGLTCRVYRTPDGPAGVPTLDQVRHALAAADGG
ncbi:hypothetical protein [Streptomyces sp. NPDC006510]|uniref:DsbA family protein n=1 Tax=Streptomyces sp. NPDC006510 TaxID=3155600 RepID=UPI0033B2626C